MNFKNAVIFLSGVGLGAVSTYFILKDKFEQQANQEAEDLKAYYEDMYANRPYTDDVELDDIHEDAIVNESDEEKKDEPDYNEIVNKLNYNQYSTKVPSPVDGEVQPAKKPYQISMDEYNEDMGYVKKIISYFEEDEVCMDNDTKEVLDNVAKDLGIDNLELINTEGNDEIYIRNEKLGIDYNVVSEPGSYEDYIDE